MPQKKVKGPSVIARPVAITWSRGRAWLDGDYVCMDRLNEERYEPLRVQKELISAVTRVRSPEDAVAFVEGFGLLYHPLIEPDLTEAVARNPWGRYTSMAEHVRGIVRLHRAIAAASDGDDTARQYIRSWAEQRRSWAEQRAKRQRTEEAEFLRDVENENVRVMKHLDIPLRKAAAAEKTKKAAALVAEFTRLVDSGNLPVMLQVASGFIAVQLTQELMFARPLVYDRSATGEAVRPGILRIGVEPGTLAQVCYLALAFALAEKEPLDVCPECERVFVIEDKRQKFCSPGCANRTRFRRFQTKKGKNDGKKARKG
jgi:hypothetical protein